MINVDGQNIVLGGTDGVLLKELSYLIGVLHTRIVSRGVHSSNAVTDAVVNAVSNGGAYQLDDLRSDARMAAEQERMRAKRERNNDNVLRCS